MERDIRAIAVSAYHMFTKVPSLNDYVEKYKLHDIDTFARHLFEGKNVYGCPVGYNKAWRKFAAENPIDVIWLKYEGKTLFFGEPFSYYHSTVIHFDQKISK